ncbi:DapH/DapD/GlmU-related protein [Halopseudomonas aestusnigri]|uniref:acyltransferase n=1 Tax=Halopseudomonas aestusnigri TaxID=857252 RepID=UPI0025527CEB|nr:DapH/DapD/GlmU-related protein [Halopseudomonas aestusnigri]MDL2200408.1 DapH/DapD/GlmU-related protein [Halopseudomonas aestusnigri]
MKSSIVRRIVKAAALKLKPLMKLILGAFFDREFLRGRHFEDGFSGYIWGFHCIWTRNILRLEPVCRFPISHRAKISNPMNIDFHVDDLNNFQSPGIYLQNFSGNIVIGRGTYIAPNVGIITANHDLVNLDQHVQGENVIIGEGCWIGMNSVILPGVTLGDKTIVGAGSVVTKSFTEGGCIIAGNPARVIRKVV